MIYLYSLVFFKSSSLVGKMCKICADTFLEAPPKYCARIVPHKFCTISAHFLVPPRMFRTNFRGPVGTTLRTNFAQFSQTCGMFLESASVQANNVSKLGVSSPCCRESERAWRQWKSKKSPTKFGDSSDSKDSKPLHPKNKDKETWNGTLRISCSRGVKSLCPRCETKTSLLSQFSLILPSFSQI